MRTAHLIFAAVLFQMPMRAQDVTVQMQRALYLEQTAGDLNGAIQIYRQILAHGVDAPYEAEAEFRLGACLLKTGDKAMAARAFQQLIRTHPEATKLVTQATTHFVDAEVGYSFTVPLGWSITTHLPRQGPGACADLEDPEHQASVAICAKPEAISAGNIDERMAKGEAADVQQQRTRFLDFTLRDGSPIAGTLAGQHALTLIADYAWGFTRQTVFTTWVQTEATRSSITVRVPTQQFAEFRARFRPILHSFRIR